MRQTIEQLKAAVAEAHAKYRRGRQHGTPRQINIRAIVATEVAAIRGNIAPEYVREHTRLREDLGFDDLDLIGLALALEAHANMLRPLDLSGCGRVADVVHALARAMGAGMPPMEDERS